MRDLDYRDEFGATDFKGQDLVWAEAILSTANQRLDRCRILYRPPSYVLSYS